MKILVSDDVSMKGVELLRENGYEVDVKKNLDEQGLIDCIGDRKGEIMLRQVVRLCYELGLYTTAEGVEAEDQVDFLRALDCTDIQGYFFSPPLPVEKYTEKLRQQARKRA